MRITVLQKPLNVNKYLYYGIVLLAVCQGAPCVGQTKGENKQRQTEQQVSPTQTPLPTVETMRKEPEARQTEERAERPIQVTIADNRSRVFEWAGIVINFGLLLIVAYQAYANKQQLGFMRQQLEDNKADSERHERAVKAAEEDAKIAKEAFYVGERPYFGFTNLGLSISSLRPSVKCRIVNGGRTPAWAFDPQFWILVGKTTDTAKKWHLNKSNMVYAHRFFAVGQEYDFTFYRDDLIFSQQDVDTLHGGDVRLFIAGTLHYKDLRGEKQWQNFTAVWNPSDGTVRDWDI